MKPGPLLSWQKAKTFVHKLGPETREIPRPTRVTRVSLTKCKFWSKCVLKLVAHFHLYLSVLKQHDKLRINFRISGMVHLLFHENNFI